MKHSLPQAKRASTRTKALVTGGLIALTAAGVGGAAFASFTGSTSASQSIGSGTLSLSGIGTDGPGNRLTVGASDIAPGDTIQRAVTITTNGSVAINGMTLDTAPSGPLSALTTDTTNGLHMTIDSCDQAWDESPTTPYTYTCAGTETEVLANTTAIGTGRTLTPVNTTSGGTNYLRVTLDLPTSADDTFQDLSSTIDYTFKAVQRAGQPQ